MRDKEIRTKIKETYLKKYYDDINSKVVDEFSVGFGDARMDIAVINGHLHGYEIKSDFDTLRRLPSQIETYSKTFDYLTLVIGQKHLEPVLQSAPVWCGVMVAISRNNNIILSYVRKPKKNSKIEKLSLAQLLWREEALEILKAKGIEKGLTNKAKPILWNLIIEKYTLSELSTAVRNILKLRAGWKSDLPLSQNDDCSLFVST